MELGKLMFENWPIPGCLLSLFRELGASWRMSPKKLVSEHTRSTSGDVSVKLLAKLQCCANIGGYCPSAELPKSKHMKITLIISKALTFQVLSVETL